MIVPVLIMTIIGIAAYHYRLRDIEQISPQPASADVPDFKSFSDVKEKKLAFFSYMLPMVREANAIVMQDREFLLRMENLDKYSTRDTERLLDLRSRYKMSATNAVDTTQIDELLKRVDIVPTSLILAQSANESAWGTSRFAMDANNYFGIWCFSKGCGLTPMNRDEGLHHEVARFDSIKAGIVHYIHTINTHTAYEELRSIRRELRLKNEALSGIEMAEGLLKYSERGPAYVHEIQAMIRYNNLQSYNLYSSSDTGE